ncbi:rhoptry protein ROP18 [Besnoitia besnoiti]|uniref:mitogen-activated protein kinase kinase n=1 Tax=Besnoitia besnoiti TaxID=94643 RepID=A0A2A9MEG0_BESBE|nr:rhoptry protein ROP18 [Besnoitia besnoiti]PFH34017.1 rhoptry protein ROP18 [Besnoitia besnoiti]
MVQTLVVTAQSASTTVVTTFGAARVRCVAGLAASALVLLLHQIQGGSSFVQASFKPKSANVLYFPALDHAHHQWPGGRPHVGHLSDQTSSPTSEEVSWIQRPSTQDETAASGREPVVRSPTPPPSGQPSTKRPASLWKRVKQVGTLLRNKWAKRREAASRKQGSPFREKIRLAWHHVKRLAGRGVPYLISKIRDRLRVFLPRRESRALYFDAQETGDAAVAHLIKLVSEEIETIQSIPSKNVDFKARQDAVSNTWWPPNSELQLVSHWTGATRTLLRGRQLGTGGWAVVYSATDTETGEEFAVKVIAISGGSPADDESVEAESQIYMKFRSIGTPQEAQERLRFMVANDLMAAAGPPFKTVLQNGSLYTVSNQFILFPKAALDLVSLLKALHLNSDVSLGPHARAARLQLTAHAIKFAAILQTQQLVHGDIKPPNILIMNSGRAMLSDFTSVSRRGTVDLIYGTDAYFPPEYTPGQVEGKYTYALDSWQIGILIFQIWCLFPPEHLQTKRRAIMPLAPSDTGAPPLEERPLDFSACQSPVPEPVQSLVSRLLTFSPSQRLRSLEAMHSPEFQEIEDELSRTVSAYRQSDQVPATTSPHDPSGQASAASPDDSDTTLGSEIPGPKYGP